MSDFIKKYTEIQSPISGIPILLSDNHGFLDELMKSYVGSLEDKDFLMQELNRNDNQFVEIRNIYTIIEAIKNSDKKNTLNTYNNRIIEVMLSRIQTKIGQGKKDNVWSDLNILLLCNPSVKQIQTIQDDLPLYCYDDILDCYLSQSNTKEYTEILKKRIIGYDGNRLRYLPEDHLDYIKKDHELSKVFWNALIENGYSLRTIFEYSLRDEKAQTLMRDILAHIEKNHIYTSIFSLYQKVYHDNDIFSYRDAIKTDFFLALLETYKDDNDFFIQGFEYFFQDNNQRHQETFQFLKTILTSKNIIAFLSYQRDFYIIGGLYTSYKHEKKEDLATSIYARYKEKIEENEERNKEYTHEQQKLITQKEQEQKNKIASICDGIIQAEKDTGQRYFSSLILYKYKQYKDLFTEDQKDFVRKQIDIYMTSLHTDPSSEHAQVELHDGGGFSRPGFMQDLFVCEELFDDLGIDYRRYQQRLIHMIPYGFGNKIIDDTKIFNLTNEDIDWLLDVYEGKKHGGLKYLHPEKFITIITNEKKFPHFLAGLNKEQKDRLSAVIRSFITDTTHQRISQRTKQAYIDILIQDKKNNTNALSSDWIETYYQSLKYDNEKYNYFDDYLRGELPEDKQNNYELFVKLNEAMMLMYGDHEAVQWRIDQLFGIKKDFIRILREGSYSISNLENELQRLGRKNKSFYEPLFDVLAYGDGYVKLIENILLKGKKFGEDSLIKDYLYKFVARYYKTVPQKDQISVFNNLVEKDRYFVLRYLDYNKRDEERKKEFDFFVAKKRIEKLEEENERLKKTEKDYNDIMKNHKNVFLYVEGESDKNIIEKAYYEIYQKLIPYRTIVSGGVNGIHALLTGNIYEQSNGVFIGLLDFDYNGITTRGNTRDLKNKGISKNIQWKQNKYQNIYENKIEVKNYGFYSFILLPVLGEFEKQLSFAEKETYQSDQPLTFLQVDGFYSKHSNPHMTIEHLLYCRETKTYFDEFKTCGGGGVIKFKGDKKNEFAQYVIETIIPTDIRNNFRPIFEYIDHAIAEYKKNDG